MTIAYVNGEFLPLDKASIPILDRGFLFADSIYEVIPVYDGRILFIDEHLKRLHYSLEQTRINFAVSDDELLALFNRLIEENGHGDMQIYFQVTRGNTGSRSHDITEETQPSLIAFGMNLVFPSFETAAKGLSAITLEDIRWERCDIKTTALLGNILMNDEAIRQGIDTTILLRDGIVTESCAANVFLVNDHGQLLTPVKDTHCLPGITRDLAVNLAKEAGIDVLETDISKEQLEQAAELFITSTTKELFPIIELDGKPVGQGIAGPVWSDLFNRFKTMTRAHD